MPTVFVSTDNIGRQIASDLFCYNETIATAKARNMGLRRKCLYASSVRVIVNARCVYGKHVTVSLKSSNGWQSI